MYLEECSAFVSEKVEWHVGVERIPEVEEAFTSEKLSS